MTDPAAYVEQLRKCYGDLSSPRREFALEAAGREPFKGILDELSALGDVTDDTDVNCDVCFTFIVDVESPLIVKLSMVGPYAAVLSFGRDGLASRGMLLTPRNARHVDDIFTLLQYHGFILPTADVLQSSVPIAFPGGSQVATLYAALFEPEGELPWRT